jgi:hypothetical protein
MDLEVKTIISFVMILSAGCHELQEETSYKGLI